MLQIVSIHWIGPDHREKALPLVLCETAEHAQICIDNFKDVLTDFESSPYSSDVDFSVCFWERTGVEINFKQPPKDWSFQSRSAPLWRSITEKLPLYKCVAYNLG